MSQKEQMEALLFYQLLKKNFQKINRIIITFDWNKQYHLKERFLITQKISYIDWNNSHATICTVWWRALPNPKPIVRLSRLSSRRNRPTPSARSIKELTQHGPPWAQRSKISAAFLNSPQCCPPKSYRAPSCPCARHVVSGGACGLYFVKYFVSYIEPAPRPVTRPPLTVGPGRA